MFYYLQEKKIKSEDMYVEKVNLNKGINYSQNKAAAAPAANYESGIQTSLYKTKGMNVYFGSLVKGADLIENQCIDILRAARDGVKRRFAENDIEDILVNLKPVKNPKEKPEILQQVLALDGEFSGVVPDRKMFKNLVGLISEKPEHVRYAILQFAENELQNSTKPMETFMKLPYRVQNDLTKLLVTIDDVNNDFLFKNDNARASAVDALYDTFRVALYAHDDMADVEKIFRGSYKRKNLELLKSDYAYYDRFDGYKSDDAKRLVLDVVDEITGYFEKNI